MYYDRKYKKSQKRKKKKFNERWDVMLIEVVFLITLYFHEKLGAGGVIAIVILFIGLLVGINQLKIKSAEKRYLNSGMTEIDNLSGEDFERFLAAHFRKEGYRVELTPKTQDYGVDLIISKNGCKIAVQAKRYADNVGIKAIQEICAGKNYYKADKAMVITNSSYTSNARRLAVECGVDLWDRNRMIEKFKISEVDAFRASSEYKDSMVCPYCEGKLVRRKSVYGEFLGCSNYPKCRYKRSIKK